MDPVETGGSVLLRGSPDHSEPSVTPRAWRDDRRSLVTSRTVRRPRESDQIGSSRLGWQDRPHDSASAAPLPVRRRARDLPGRPAGGLHRPAGARPAARPHPGQAGQRPAGPLRRAAGAAHLDHRPQRHRRAQLRRPGGPARAAGDLRRAAGGRAGAAARRRQLEPDDDAPGPDLPAAVGRPGLRAGLEGRAGRQVRLPGARLRPALLDAGRPGHRDAQRADARGRPRRRGGRRAGGRRPRGQGHVGGADLRQPDGLGGLPRGGAGADVDADRRPRLPGLLGQRLRAAPPGRRGGAQRRRARSGGRGRSPRPAGHVRLDLQDHLGRRRRGVHGDVGGQQGLVPAPPVDGLDRARQGQPAAPRAALRRRRGRARAHAPAPRAHRTEVRGRGRRAHRRPRGPRGRRVDPAHRRLLRQPRRARRHRHPGGRAGQGGRDRPDPRRRLVPARPGPAGPQHPARADLPAAGAGRDRHGRCGHLRGAGRGRAAARRLGSRTTHGGPGPVEQGPGLRRTKGAQAIRPGPRPRTRRSWCGWGRPARRGPSSWRR